MVLAWHVVADCCRYVKQQRETNTLSPTVAGRVGVGGTISADVDDEIYAVSHNVTSTIPATCIAQPYCYHHLHWGCGFSDVHRMCYYSNTFESENSNPSFFARSKPYPAQLHVSNINTSSASAKTNKWRTAIFQPNVMTITTVQKQANRV